MSRQQSGMFALSLQAIQTNVTYVSTSQRGLRIEVTEAAAFSKKYVSIRATKRRNDQIKAQFNNRKLTNSQFAGFGRIAMSTREQKRHASTQPVCLIVCAHQGRHDCREFFISIQAM